MCDVYRTKGRYGDGKQQKQQQRLQQQVAADRFTYMSVLVFTQCVVSATVARLGNCTYTHSAVDRGDTRAAGVRGTVGPPHFGF